MRIVALILISVNSFSQVPLIIASQKGSGGGQAYYVANGSSGQGTMSSPFSGQQLKDSLDAGWVTYNGNPVLFKRGDTFRYQYDFVIVNIKLKKNAR
jgi:hypothetical protein